MKPDTPLIAAEAIEQLLTTAQDGSNLLQVPTGLLPVLLQQRLNWLDLWNATLAPVFESSDAFRSEFPLKPPQVTDLLRAWRHGLPVEPSDACPNAAALMLMGYAGVPELVLATQHWVAQLAPADGQLASYQAVEQGLSMAKWFRHWGRQAAELVLLEALQSVVALSPQDQERLTQLGGERWKGMRMQIDSTCPTVSQRSRTDSHSLERYFKDQPEAARTLLALRAKPMGATNERLTMPRGGSEAFLSALVEQVAALPLVAQDFDVYRQTINLVDAYGAEPSPALLFRARRNAFMLMLTLTEKEGIADIRLATLVVADDLTLDAYCRRVIQVNDEGESPNEQIVRGVIIDAVNQALHTLRPAVKSDAGQLAG